MQRVTKQYFHHVFMYALHYLRGKATIVCESSAMFINCIIYICMCLFCVSVCASASVSVCISLSSVCLFVCLFSYSKGPYPLGDLCMIGDRIGRRRPILLPILSPITLWVWPFYWPTGRLVAGQPELPGD